MASRLPVNLAAALLVAGCGPSTEPIYLRCDAKDARIAPKTDEYLLMLVDPQRNQIKSRFVCPDCLDVTTTYQINATDDPTLFVGMNLRWTRSSGLPTFIGVNRVSGATRVDYEPPSASLYYDCTSTKPIL